MTNNPETTDLTGKLRARIQRTYVGLGTWAEIPDPLCRAAAREIDRLHGALEEIAGLTQFIGDDPVAIARLTLGLKALEVVKDV